MKRSLLASAFLAASLALSANAVGGGNFLAERHGDKCGQCHEERVPSKAPKMAKCLKCHEGSYEALAKSTADTHPNPHYTHIGDKECAACHKGHEESELFCNDCHNFKLKMP